MEKTIALIGGGNMGSAIVGGMLGAGLVRPQQVTVSDVSQPLREQLRERFGVGVTQDNCLAAGQADILILSVKPNLYPTIIQQIAPTLKEEAVVVSIAAGASLSYLRQLFGRPVKLVRVMPNTPALVGEGMAALCAGEGVQREELEQIREIFESFGRAEEISESLMDAVTAVSGSSPAYVYLFIEALADGAVAGGMPRAQAYTFAAQAVLGAAKMVLESGMHPGQLKDMVCSPGGTTIDAVAELERTGLRASVLAAVEACLQKSRQMTK